VTVYLVGAGPGDPGLITRRGAELLAEADVVVYDRLIDRSLLALAPKGALLIDAGKRPAADPGTDRAPARAPTGAARQGEINELLIAHGRTGATVVRLKGGDPFLFGRGGEEADALTKVGVAWEVVPGVTSAMAVPAAAGIPVTQRGLSTSVTVVTGQVGDEAGPGGVDWESLARANGTLVILMGMATRGEISRRLRVGGRPPSEPVAVVEWGTTVRQRVIRTTLAELEAVQLGSPAVIVVGAVAALELSSLAPPPLHGRSVVVTRARPQGGALSRALRALGAHVIELPVIDIAEVPGEHGALEQAAGSLERYQWLAFTSVNAVERFIPLIRDVRRLSLTRLAAVGRGTASALEAHQLLADLVPTRSNSEGLADEFPLTEEGGRVLFVKAQGAGETLAARLAAKGWTVDEVVAYRTGDAPSPRAEVVAVVADADVVTFASASAVSAYLRLVDTDGHRLPIPPVVACIGPTTSAAARSAGLSVAVEPAQTTIEALVLAIVDHLGDGPEPLGVRPGLKL
jgi:uroporphyrinogen III methyltransferase/synthase